MNVDECVRYAELGMIDNYDEYADKIASLDNSIKPIVFRNKTADEVKQFLEESHNTICQTLNKDLYGNNADTIVLEKASNNNKKGADLYHMIGNDRVDIELKFGSITNMNIGVSKCSKILGIKTVEDVLNRNIRKRWKKEYIENIRDDVLQEEDLRNLLNEAIEDINQQIFDKAYTEDWNNLFEQNVFNITGDRSSRAKYFYIFCVENGKLVHKQSYQTGKGKWVILPVVKIENNDRLHIRVYNASIETTVDFCLNWKNDYKIQELNRKIPAKLGLGTPSWNVWIDED